MCSDPRSWLVLSDWVHNLDQGHKNLGLCEQRQPLVQVPKFAALKKSMCPCSEGIYRGIQYLLPQPIFIVMKLS